MQENPLGSRQLSNDERAALKQELTTKSSALKSRTLGFKVRGQQLVQEGAVAAKIPQSLADAELSVCGVKGFMIDETREFERADGSSEEVDCASVATLYIVDSPIHMHGVTQEVYTVLSGKGKMVLGNEVIDVEEGSVVVLPTGVEHGLASNDPDQPVKVLLSFTPGIAPKSKPEFRDEKIVFERTTKRIAHLLQEARKDALNVAEVG